MKYTNERIKFLKEDLFYELRMLFSASMAVQLFEKLDLGNPTNLLKDSAYVHTRNLYNFFSGEKRYDASIKKYIDHAFDLTLYDKWSKALHTHVLHIKTDRLNKLNVVDGTHINTMIPVFAINIEILWLEWHSQEKNIEIKEIIISVFNRAKEESSNDYMRLVKRLNYDKK